MIYVGKEIYSNITGVILSGGESKRMGYEKSLLKIGDKTVIRIIAELMAEIFRKVVVSANEPEKYNFLNLPIIPDTHNNIGPLAGIYSGLVNSTTEKNFFISCDLPMMKEETIRYIINYQTEKKIAVPFFNEQTQYLCGIYSKSIIRNIEDLIGNYRNNTGNNLKKVVGIKNLIEIVGAERIQDATFRFFNDDVFFNMNTPEDYEYVKKKYLI
ncbi:MAG: molybdenum cofactor guanylyltransferase [Melioribacter sp.]|nr:molybdenum cofactor guanylyltransferase [Melioribacter sp.]